MRLDRRTLRRLSSDRERIAWTDVLVFGLKVQSSAERDRSITFFGVTHDVAMAAHAE